MNNAKIVIFCVTTKKYRVISRQGGIYQNSEYTDFYITCAKVLFIFQLNRLKRFFNFF